MDPLTPKSRPRRGRWRQSLWGYAFISPWLLGFLVFTAGPMLFSIALSFCRYDLVNIRYVGLANYHRLLTEDPLFYKSLWNTATYTLFSVPLGLCGSLLLAILLNQKVKLLSFFRTAYYLPSLVPAVAGALLWMWILQPESGLLNQGLSSLGIKGPQWLASTRWAMPSFIIMSLWGIGGSRMLIFLAGLQGISDQYYEAAELDGASMLSRFWHITLPLLSPIIFFNLVLGIIGSFQVFTSAYVMTGGGPNYATLFYVLYMFQQGFQQLRMGYASAMAWILFALLFVFTFIQFRHSKRWVYYEGEAQE